MQFATLLKPEAVKVLTSASSKKRLMQDIGDLVSGAYGMDAGRVVEALIARESLGPTGVGHGVALPHARLDGLNEVVGLCSFGQADRFFLC
jgi:PTS system nitrogen regulatory IIA component